MNFELSISGLCVIILKSTVDRPTQPDGIEILCVDAHCHRPRLGYWPDQVVPEVEADLCVDPRGEHMAAWDLRGKVVDLSFKEGYEGQFALTWGEPKSAPDREEEEVWMNWVPTVQDLGIAGIPPSAPRKLPPGASARIILPPGELKARNVLRNRDRNGYLQWKFFPDEEGKEFKRAVANDVVFSARDVGRVTVSLSGESEAKLEAQLGDRVLEMGVSNDMTKVPKDYNGGIDVIDHLTHIAGLAGHRSVVKVPKLAQNQRTGWPICNQVLFVEKPQE